MNKRNKIGREIGLITLITSTCFFMFTCGFSSWVLVDNIVTFKMTSYLGDFENIDFGDSVQYIINSERGFDFYYFQGKQVFTKTTFSYRFKINPHLLKEKFENSSVDLVFGLKYKASLFNDVDLFSPDNSFCVSPKQFTCKVDSSANREMKSRTLVFDKSQSNTEYTYTLTGNICLYDDVNPSLYDLTKDFSNTTNDYVYLTVTFPFEILSLNGPTFESINFNFISNINKGANA